jgi:hypothetical protein
LRDSFSGLEALGGVGTDSIGALPSHG